MNKQVLLTGANGFLGRHIKPVLCAQYGIENVAAVSSTDYDLMNSAEVKQMFNDISPNIVVHLAAYSGGIGANRSFPADFYFRNTVLTALTFEEAARRGVGKLIYTMGGCSYPANASSPIDEEQLFTGYPQVESAGYSTAKMMGVVAARSYKQQYGLNATVLIPGNLYGEFDNFRNSESHVVPAMIRRYFEAKRNGRSSVEMWGTGTPTRDFTYAGDVAKCIPFFIDSYDQVGPVNLCTARSTSIRELAEIIARLVGYEGKINWDSTKTDGQKVKIFSNKMMRDLDLSCDTFLEEGLGRTIEWLERNYDSRGDNLRL